MPFAPAQQPVQGACLTDGQVRPPENPADEGHGIPALEGRVVNRVQVPVDVAVEVAHIVR